MNESIFQFLSFFFFVFGSLLGSFSNVVVLRMAISKSVIFPPSACPKCDHQLHAIDLIPVFSWLFLRGKCRYCKAPISWQYPLVESSMAAIIGFSFVKCGLTPDFMGLAPSMAIWFVASVIFLRNEVKLHQPFFWAMVYIIALNYFLRGFAFDAMFVYAAVSGLAAGLIAAANRNEQSHAFAWGALTAIFALFLTRMTSPLIALVLLPALLLNIKASMRRWAIILFFALQTAGLISVIAMQPGV